MSSAEPGAVHGGSAAAYLSAVPDGGAGPRDVSGAGAPAVPPVPGAALSVPRRAGGGALIETKLHAPALRREWVPREDLVGYLAGCSSCRLVLVEAPAGFGKTIAVAQWAASGMEDRPFAWVCLDRGDDDPARLWLHVVSALQRACPQFGGEDIVRALRSPVPDIAGTVLPLLANELASLAGRVVLVLDDFHLISDQGCQDQVGLLLSHLPAGVQLVLVTRADPPLPVARLRASGELAELLGCRIENGFVVTDEVLQTSIPGIYCAGEPNGIGGVELSLLEGRIAALAASGSADIARSLARQRRRKLGFVRALEQACALDPRLRELPAQDTIVCRCEDVRHAALREHTGWREAKLHTRCGMGPCQGRICGPATEFLFNWRVGSVRPPLFPSSVASLVSPREPATGAEILAAANASPENSKETP